MATIEQPCIRKTVSSITIANRWDHFLARWGYRRGEHRVEPGLYAIGNPTPDSPVFVTANYTLSFDALRSSLKGMDGHILVLDTLGINVWCAAGKGTFGTDELVHRIEATGLHDIVRHRVLVLPQLGAPGVSAHEVKSRSGFRVEYGPVRAGDLPAYLKTRRATPEMRRVRFTLGDRLILIPVELVHVLLPFVIAVVVLYLIGGFMAAAASFVVLLAGTTLFPILLPWIPTSQFSTKGFILGGVVALPFALVPLHATLGWMQLGVSLTYLLAMTSITAFLALNFTGATTFASRSGVRREIFSYVPVMASMFGASIIIIVVVSLIRLIGGR